MSPLDGIALIACVFGLWVIAVKWDTRTDDKDGIRELRLQQKKKFPPVDPSIREKLEAKAKRIADRG